MYNKANSSDKTVFCQALQHRPEFQDGGDPISGYVIEKRKKHAKDWVECAKVNGPVYEASVLGLKEGEEYQFRIRAVNNAGMGEPSDPSKKVITKPRNCKSLKILIHLSV